MNFTSIDAVAAHFPGFQRGVPDQNPSDAQIEVWIENEGSRVRGFAEDRGYVLAGLIMSNPRAHCLLSLANEIGAAAELGDALFSLRGPDAWPPDWANPNSLRRSYGNMLRELGRGSYDKLFLVPA